MSNEQIQALARPFPDRYIKKNPTGFGSYVTHSVVVEKIIAVTGQGLDYEIVEIIRGHVPGNDKHDPLENVIVGCLARLTLTVDGHTHTVIEVGDCEQPHNWPHDGARLKDAASDAIKRCAMRGWGIGIHLWSQDQFVLDRALARKEEGQE